MSERNRARTAAVMRALPSGPEARSHSISAIDPGRLPIPTQSTVGYPEISTKEVEEESGDTEQERLDAAHATAVARTVAESRKKDIARGYGAPTIHGGAFDSATSEAFAKVWRPAWAERFVPFQRYRDLAKEGGVLEEYDESPMERDHGLYDYDFAPTTEQIEPAVDYIQYEPKEAAYRENLIRRLASMSGGVL